MYNEQVAKLNHELHHQFSLLVEKAAKEVIGDLDLREEILSRAIGGMVSNLIKTSKSSVEVQYNQSTLDFSIRYCVKGDDLTHG